MLAGFWFVMPRPARELIEGGIYHVYSRGNDRRDIFLGDGDRWKYLELLADVVGRKGWRLLGYCLMDNHTHLLTETPHANLDSGMQLLHGRFARWFNDEHKHSGHLFQGRYGAARIESDAHLWAVATYIASNPVAAGITETCEGWPWSSHRATLEPPVPPWLDAGRLLSFFGRTPGVARRRYAALAAEMGEAAFTAG